MPGWRGRGWRSARPEADARPGDRAMVRLCFPSGGANPCFRPLPTPPATPYIAPPMSRPKPATFDKVKIVAENRRARFDYAIDTTYEAGIVLTGTEV